LGIDGSFLVNLIPDCLPRDAEATGDLSLGVVLLLPNTSQESPSPHSEVRDLLLEQSHLPRDFCGFQEFGGWFFVA
jgi:hypothetical protein